MAVDLSILEHHEQRYRDRLIDDPSNPDARLDLAWCLFLRAVWTVAREEGPKYGSDSAVPQARQSAERRREDARLLLLNGLREAIKVSRLSLDPAHHVDAARLEFLMELIGEQAVIESAQGQVDSSMKRLVSDVSAKAAQGGLLREMPVPVSLSTGRSRRRAPHSSRPGNPNS